MGTLRSCYTAPARFKVGGPVSTIKYYFAAHGAAVYTQPNVFHPLSQYRQFQPPDGVGELHTGRYPYSKGILPHGPDGIHVDGTPDDFLGLTPYTGPSPWTKCNPYKARSLVAFLAVAVVKAPKAIPAVFAKATFHQPPANVGFAAEQSTPTYHAHPAMAFGAVRAVFVPYVPPPPATPMIAFGVPENVQRERASFALLPIAPWELATDPVIAMLARAEVLRHHGEPVWAMRAVEGGLNARGVMAAFGASSGSGSGIGLALFGLVAQSGGSERRHAVAAFGVSDLEAYEAEPVLAFSTSAPLSFSRQSGAMKFMVDAHDPADGIADQEVSAGFFVDASDPSAHPPGTDCTHATNIEWGTDHTATIAHGVQHWYHFPVFPGGDYHLTLTINLGTIGVATVWTGPDCDHLTSRGVASASTPCVTFTPTFADLIWWIEVTGASSGGPGNYTINVNTGACP